MADIIPIFKKGSKHDPANYRPVSLTSVISKICESLIRDEIVDHLLATEQLHEAQHGFRSGKSCITKLLACLEDWTKCIENGTPVDIAYLDYKKAFDSVPHKRLLKKLHGLGIRGRVLAWIERFLLGRQQRVVVNGVKSTWSPVLSGIPQGTVLGPTLFLAFVNDLPSSIQSRILMFADDTTVYNKSATSEDREQFQHDLDALSLWSMKWLLPFNSSKCRTLHLGSDNNKQRYTLAGLNIEQTTEERDLGVVIDENLKFRRQAAIAVSKANRVLGTIRRSFATLDKLIFPILYKTLVRPLLEYGNAVWGPHNKEDQRLIERVQRRATKLVEELRSLPYAERLKALNLSSLQYRRHRGDVILVYQMLQGRLNIHREVFFKEPSLRTTRGHPHKLAKPHAQTRARRNHWSIRVINDWNSLPADIVTAGSLNEFKNKIDKHWVRNRYSHP